MKAYEKIQIARMAERPTATTYVKNVIDDFIELHGDRNVGDDASIIGGIGMLYDMPVTVIAQEKGVDINDKIKRNFGCPHPEGYRKALRLMKQAEKFNRPILNIVDTPGAYCGIGAEERGQGEAIAKNLFEMMDINVPIISVFIGEGGSGGALALAVCDRVYMLEYSVYSILSPEGFASILWKDSSRVEEACEVMKITADDLKEMGIIEGIVKEPTGGAQNDIEGVCKDIKELCYKEFKKLKALNKEDLTGLRYDKFRKIGADVY